MRTKILSRLHKYKTFRKKILGKEFVILKGVFRPDLTLMSKYFVKNMEIPKNAKVLEVGCGSGIISYFASKKAQVLGVDVNPQAVKCAKMNGVNAIQSDLFSNVTGKYDVILTNPPYLKGHAKSLIEKSWFEDSFIDKFLKNAKSYLKKNGKIILGYSSVADRKYLHSLIKRYGYKFRIVAKKNVLIEKLYLYELSN